MLALATALRDRQRRFGSPPPPSAGGTEDADGWDGGGGGGTGGGASGTGCGFEPLPDSGPGGGPEGCSDEEDRELMTLAP
ncbi:hypothetical protein [Streptomyces erythrochromogenes]|uniref:hypothetical protein n=1 Tax=Streptomyces erythrochromogenes TaxID=285574 RepID=UPI0036BB2002